MNTEIVLEMQDIVKDFPGLRANDHISLQLHRGEILALLGENGAGKSTLMNILMGIYRADSGRILIQGKPVQIKGPRDANELGIGMVHQHFKLVHNFTVTENIVLGLEPGSPFHMNLKGAQARVKALSETYGMEIDPTARIEKITVGMQQRTEILKMLYRDADILVFDEPTAVLMPREIDELMQIIRNLARQGKSIILITHKLKEIKQTADRCVIIRRGAVVDTVSVADTSSQEMADKMVGRQVSFHLEKEAQKPGPCILRVEGLNVKNTLGSLGLKDFSFEVHQGEIVGIAGVDGNGQTELVEAITGLRPACGGRIWLDGQEITGLPVSERIRAGLSHVPEDRQRRGLVMDFSLEDNLILGSSTWKPFACKGLLQREAIRSHAREIIQRFDVRSSEGAESRAASLSGGNQQKAIVGREIEKPHKLLIAVQPTRGMDVGSIEYIRKRLLEERKNGKAVLLVSLELDEVLQLSDRIIAVNNGRLIGELSQAEATESNVGLMMAGVALREGQNG